MKSRVRFNLDNKVQDIKDSFAPIVHNLHRDLAILMRSQHSLEAELSEYDNSNFVQVESKLSSSPIFTNSIDQIAGWRIKQLDTGAIACIVDWSMNGEFYNVLNEIKRFRDDSFLSKIEKDYSIARSDTWLLTIIFFRYLLINNEYENIRNSKLLSEIIEIITDVPELNVLLNSESKRLNFYASRGQIACEVLEYLQNYYHSINDYLHQQQIDLVIMKIYNSVYAELIWSLNLNNLQQSNGLLRPEIVEIASYINPEQFSYYNSRINRDFDRANYYLLVLQAYLLHYITEGGFDSENSKGHINSIIKKKSYDSLLNILYLIDDQYLNSIPIEKRSKCYAKVCEIIVACLKGNDHVDEKIKQVKYISRMFSTSMKFTISNLLSDEVLNKGHKFSSALLAAVYDSNLALHDAAHLSKQLYKYFGIKLLETEQDKLDIELYLHANEKFAQAKMALCILRDSSDLSLITQYNYVQAYVQIISNNLKLLRQARHVHNGCYPLEENILFKVFTSKLKDCLHNNIRMHTIKSIIKTGHNQHYSISELDVIFNKNNGLIFIQMFNKDLPSMDSTYTYVIRNDKDLYKFTLRLITHFNQHFDKLVKMYPGLTGIVPSLKIYTQYQINDEFNLPGNASIYDLNVLNSKYAASFREPSATLLYDKHKAAFARSISEPPVIMQHLLMQRADKQKLSLY